MGIDRLEDCLRRHPALENCAYSIKNVFEEFRLSFESGGKLLICGNGGSAADSDHLAAELLKGFDSRRTLDETWQEKLGVDLAKNLQGALPVIPLTGFSALTTAYANDCDGNYTFAQLVFALGQKEDVLLCISTSGNSKNVLLAAEVAKAKGMRVVGLTGESGGELLMNADVCICVPSKVVWEIQEMHLPVYHTICLMLEDAFFGKS
jgi:D-sedoheptulose 7-phosphate isomerase